MEPIVIKEYEEKDIKDCDLDNLQSYIKCQNLSSALKVTRHGIKANSWVGVIKYKKTHFQILPKLICDNENKECILKNLIYMLSYTENLDIKTNEDAKLSAERNPFIEILIREYAKSLFDCLIRLTPKQYTREEDNLKFIKGKMKFSENIRYNCTNQAKFYCEYDKFSEDNILNQLFLFVSTCLYNISNNSYNKKTLKFIINYYSDITFVRFDKFKVRKIKLTRNQELFKKSFNLAKMFVEQTSVDLSKNRFENITLVWDMNALFEEFVFEIMKKSCPDWILTAQKGKKLLKGTENKKRNTFVDIFAQKEDQKLIIDTKYKKFVDENSFSNADVFQVSTYCLLHNTNNAILLYPQWENNKKPNIEDYYLNNGNNNYKISFKTINLKYDNLKNNIDKIKQEIQYILKQA